MVSSGSVLLGSDSVDGIGGNSPPTTVVGGSIWRCHPLCFSLLIFFTEQSFLDYSNGVPDPVPGNRLLPVTKSFMTGHQRRC